MGADDVEWHEGAPDGWPPPDSYRVAPALTAVYLQRLDIQARAQDGLVIETVGQALAAVVHDFGIPMDPSGLEVQWLPVGVALSGGWSPRRSGQTINGRIYLGGKLTLELDVPVGGEPFQLRWWMAWALQNVVIEWAGRALPACPSHNHPLEPDSNDEGSYWACPAARSTAVAAIGSL